MEGGEGDGWRGGGQTKGRREERRLFREHDVLVHVLFVYAVQSVPF